MQLNAYPLIHRFHEIYHFSGNLLGDDVVCNCSRPGAIPRSPQNPKILWVDDAEVVGDRITKACPVLGDFVAQEIERGVRELSACGVAFVVRDIPVHEAP